KLEESAGFASTDISKLDKRIRTLTVFINSSTRRQTFRRNPVGHARALRPRRSLALDKALGRGGGSGLDSQNGNRREQRVRWWRMQVDSQQCSRCSGERKRCLDGRVSNRHASIRKRRASLNQGIMATLNLAARMVRGHCALPAVLGHVMTAIPIGGSRRDSGEHAGDS